MFARFVPTQEGWLNLKFISTIRQDPDNQNQVIVTDDTGRREWVVSATAYAPFHPEEPPRFQRRFLEIENDAGHGRCFLAADRVREIIRGGDRRFVAIEVGDNDARHVIAANETFGGLLADREKGGGA
jgi:hypothetical protein